MKTVTRNFPSIFYESSVGRIPRRKKVKFLSRKPRTLNIIHNSLRDLKGLKESLDYIHTIIMSKDTITKFKGPVLKTMGGVGNVKVLIQRGNRTACVCHQQVKVINVRYLLCLMISFRE